MKKRTALMFSAGLFLVVLAVFFSLIINGSLKNEGEIILPQGSAPIEEAVDIAKRNQRVIKEVTIDTQNVKDVISTLSKPASYSYIAQTVYYYPEGSSTSSSFVGASLDMCRVITYDAVGNVKKNLILTKDNVYMWGEGDSVYFKGNRGDFSIEDEAGLPTYESILSVRTEDIIRAGLAEHNGRLCVYLTSSHELGRYTRDWYVDIDSGLLYSCDTKENGALIYSVVCFDMSIGVQDMSLFVLPNGQSLR